MIFIGKVAIHLPVVGSTNEYAKDYLAKSNPIEGTAIYADEQLAGKGQIGSRWLSPARQNVLLSLILYPKFLAAQHLFLLNQCISLGIHAALLPFLAEPAQLRIKWPNDIYIGTKKLGGVLIENTLKGDWLQHSIVGMGINVLQTNFDPALPNPTSLALESKNPLSLPQVLESLYAGIESWYLQLRAGKNAEIKDAYNQLLYRKNEWHLFAEDTQPSTFKARLIGVDETGNLQLETQTGLIRSFGVKKLHFL